MYVSSNGLTSLLLAGIAAAAIAAAPMASADPLVCADIGSATQCGSPGNSQLTATAPVMRQQPLIVIIHRNANNNR